MKTDLRNTSDLEQFACIRFGHTHFTSVLQDGAVYWWERETGAGSGLETRRLRDASSFAALGARRWFALEALCRIGSPSERGSVALCVSQLSYLGQPCWGQPSFCSGEKPLAGNVLPPLSIT